MYADGAVIVGPRTWRGPADWSLAAKITGERRNALYAMALDMK